jgi:rhodanese-related sulfurtransferase
MLTPASVMGRVRRGHGSSSPYSVQRVFPRGRPGLRVPPILLLVKHSPAFLELVNQAKARIRETDIETVARRLDSGDRFHLVDVREDDEWRAGHINGAIHIGKGVIERDIEARIPNKSDEVILYCGGGFRSALAADALRQMGYANVVSMDGGMRGWRERKLPEE